MNSTIENSIPKYVHDVCTCGCTTLRVPAGINPNQLFIKTIPLPKQQTVVVNLVFETEQPMYGWKKEHL